MSSLASRWRKWRVRQPCHLPPCMLAPMSATSPARASEVTRHTPLKFRRSGPVSRAALQGLTVSIWQFGHRYDRWLAHGGHSVVARRRSWPKGHGKRVSCGI